MSKLDLRGAAVAFLAAFVVPFAHAGDVPESPFTDWKRPAWFDAIEGVTVSFRVESSTGPGPEIVAAYEYSTGAKGDVTAVADPSDKGRFVATIPGLPEPALATLKVTARTTVNGQDLRSEPVTIPAAYVNEFDVTGNPPVVLPYALVDENYLAQYIPCCNIFGGVLVGKRIQAVPTDSREGLPEKLVSDFAVLEPDGLTQSTAGLHMQLRYDPVAVKAMGVATVALYTWDIRVWREVRSYEIDPVAGVVNFHCPDGGIFVLGEK